MKKREEVKPNYAPVYAAIYPELAKLFVENGYALAIHGSLKRDFDLIAVKWEKPITSPQRMVNKITKTFSITQIGKPKKRSYGRIAYSISVGFGECAIDLSFIN